MSASNKSSSSENAFVLGIEGGGTRTVAVLANVDGTVVKQWHGGPANLKLLSDSVLATTLAAIAAEFPQPISLGIGLAGARGEQEWKRIRAAASLAWPNIPCHATHDLETALNADKPSLESPTTRILLLSGTGSCAYGKTASGLTERVGGWGHLL